MSNGDRNGNGISLFVPGRICLFGEHSDWAGGYRRFNADVREGCALVCGTTQGIHGTAWQIPGKRMLLFSGPDGSSCELALDDVAHLREVASSSSYFAYIAGTVLELGKHFRVGGAEIINHRTDLPIRKGLSSSAAICVLVVRALNQLYDLKLTVHGEMDMAYRGELNTPSRCGRMDQCVAFGQTVTRMAFDSDVITTTNVRVAATVYLVIVDLCAAKDTKEILKCLNEAYPFPRNDLHKELHDLLGGVNLKTCDEAIEVLNSEKDPIKAAEMLGALMTAAQSRWDKSAVPLCPHELTAPTLHKLLSCETLIPYITGGKGVGSQGDGSAQLVCKSATAQDEVMKIVQGLGMEPLRLTIPAQKTVRTAVIPVAGACTGMWPATKCGGVWLFPVRLGSSVKPAICWLCEELRSAGIERIVMVVNEATEAQMAHLFKRREDVAVLRGVATDVAAYDEELLAIGRCLTLVRQDHPTGIKQALLLCEHIVGDEPFLLAWGDHLTQARGPDAKCCAAQLLEGFNGRRSVAAIHPIKRELVYTSGIFCCRNPPSPLPAPGAPVPWPIASISEKPTAEYADQHLRTPGLEEGMFLGSFGQFVLTPSIFKIARGVPYQFAEALDLLRQKEGLDGVLIDGSRWDIGNIATYVEALQGQAGFVDSLDPPGRKRPRGE